MVIRLCVIVWLVFFSRATAVAGPRLVVAGQSQPSTTYPTAAEFVSALAQRLPDMTIAQADAAGPADLFVSLQPGLEGVPHCGLAAICWCLPSYPGKA